MKPPLAVNRTEQSRLDYDQIFQYIAQRNVRAATTLIDQLDAKLAFLAAMPGAGRFRPEYGRNIQTYSVGNYLLVYRHNEIELTLLRVIHRARDVRRVIRGQ